MSEETTDTIQPGAMDMDRRDFLKIILGTASLVMIHGVDPLLAEEVAARPDAKPWVLTVDEYGYIVDPDFSYERFVLPTRREIHGWQEMSAEEQEAFLCDWEFQDWPKAELEEWFDEEAEVEEISGHTFAHMGEYAPGMHLHDLLSPREADRLGVSLIDCPQPGSDFVGVKFTGELEKLKAFVKRKGWNLDFR